MVSAKQRARFEKLKEFFEAEVHAEVRSGFSRPSQVPESHVVRKLQYYRSLSEPDRRAFLDCCAYWASAYYSFTVNLPRMGLTDHPFFSKWSRGPEVNRDFYGEKSVPRMRSMVQQYKIDLHNKVHSHITKEQFERASSVLSVKAPELRKRVRTALRLFGHYETDALGYYWCKKGKQKFAVHVDFGGRHSQLRYCVVRLEFKSVHPLCQFAFERAMGFGFGHWNYIIEENVDAIFSLFAEVVQYSLNLPDRIRAATKIAEPRHQNRV
jgi:hypothetical protein